MALKNIYYAGSAEQWEMVEIADGNDTLNKATVHYSQITIGSAEARPGENVEIPITMERNPGLTVMRLKVSYDSSVLTLESVEDGNMIGSKSHSDDYSGNPYTLYWNNHTSETNFTADGTIATLKFKVSSEATDGNYPISVSYDSAANDILNKDRRPVSFDIAAGGVTVTHIRYGDVDDNKSVEAKDSAVLDRYLADWKDYKTIHSENADVDTDGSVTVLDSMILARHLASRKGYETLPYAVPANASLMSGDTGAIKVETVRGEPGESVSVDISLEDNPGLTMMRLYVAYDGDALELQEVRDAGILGTEVHSDNYALNPYPLFWNNGTKKENFTVNGTIATLLFRIKDGAEAGGYPVTITHDAEKGDILDCDLHPVAFAATGGNVMAGLPPVTILDAKMFPSSVNSDEKGVTATVSNAIPGDTIWCNAYTESGKWIAAWSQEAVAGQTDYDFLPDKDFDYVKIFVLDAKLRPLCAYAKQ